VVVEGRSSVAGGETTRRQGAGDSGGSRGKSARQRRLAWISRRKSRRENATCLRGFLEGVAVVEERNGGGAARDGGRPEMQREIERNCRAARARKKGAADLSPN